MDATQHKTFDLTVVGGGVTGLSAAYIAAKSGHTVRVLEGSDAFGGLIRTFKVGSTDLECFYHHFFLHDKELIWLIEELDLSHLIISQKTSMGIFTGGKLYHFSTALDLIRFKPLNWLSKFRFILTTVYLGLFSNWEKKENISAFSWFEKWGGKQVLNSIWKPLLNVKFGKYDKEVPLAWMIGRIKQRFKSREKGSEKLCYIEGSLSKILDAILFKLQELGVELLLNSKVKELIVQDNRILGVKTELEDYFSDKTLLTIPNNIANHLMGVKLAEDKTIGYFGAICVVLELKKSLSPYYWLNIADEDYPFGGIIEHSNMISSDKYQNRHIVYLSKYFAMDDEIAELNEEEVKKRFIQHLKKMFPEFSEEDIYNSHLFRSNSAATVCDLNFSKKVPKVKTGLDQLFVCNMAHVYPDERSVNNSIRIAANACKVMGINSNIVPQGMSLSGSIGFQ